jgi:DNA-binding transcriptional LysR family regulator
MDIRQLKYFVVIAEEGSITKAAVRLFMAQPPLTRQLQLMEAELGVTLFERTNKRNIVLTPPGQLFLEKARMIIQNMDEAMLEIQEFGNKMTKRILIGTTIYCSEIMLPVLKKFCEEYPWIIPEVHEGNISYLIHLLKNRTIEIAITARPLPGEGFAMKKPNPDSCVLVVARDFAWDKTQISLEEISRIPLLLLQTGDDNSLYRRIRDEFDKKKLTINLASECHDSGLLLEMVLNKIGATILPQSMTKNVMLESMRVIPIENNPWTTAPYLIWRQDGYVSTTVKEFIKRF